MKTLIALMVTLGSLSANADIIRCSFTEPFISFEYSMTQSTLTEIDPVSEYPKTLKRVTKAVSFQILGAGTFELWDKNKNVVARLNLNNNGSDGMSDYVFPYDVEYKGLYGGCESNFLHAYIPAELR